MFCFLFINSPLLNSPRWSSIEAVDSFSPSREGELRKRCRSGFTFSYSSSVFLPSGTSEQQRQAKLQSIHHFSAHSPGSTSSISLPLAARNPDSSPSQFTLSLPGSFNPPNLRKKGRGVRKLHRGHFRSRHLASSLVAGLITHLFATHQ